MTIDTVFGKRHTLDELFQNNGHPDFNIVSKEEVEMIKQKWKEFPDGDVKDRPWKYYDGPIQQKIGDYFE